MDPNCTRLGADRGYFSSGMGWKIPT